MERRIANDDGTWLRTYGDLMTTLLIFFVMLLTAAEISQSKMQEIQKAMSGTTSPSSLASIQKKVDERIVEEGLEDLVETTRNDDGLKLALNSGVVFDTGAAQIRPEVVETLLSTLEILAVYSERYRFAVEGHADERPVAAGGRFQSNWELSAARAIAVRERLEGVGIDPTRIRVEGYAATQKLPEEDLTGLSESQRLARHRRVVVRIY